MGDEAEARLASHSGGHHVPDYGDDAQQAANAATTFDPADPGVQAELEQFSMAMDAAELADQIAEAIHAVLEKHEHTPCELEPYATTTLHEGVTVAMCGCGEFFPAPELAAPTVDLAPAFVDAHSPAAITVAAADPIARTLALVEPGRDYTPEEIERLMLDCVSRLELGQAFERWALEQASHADYEYEQRFALEFTKAAGAMELRRYTAMVACAGLAEAKARTDMVHRAVKAAMHNLRSTLSGYQSVLKSVQATYQTGGSAGGRPY